MQLCLLLLLLLLALLSFLALLDISLRHVSELHTLGGKGLAILRLASGGENDTDGDGLAHIADSETTKRSVKGVRLDAHGLGGDHGDDTGVTLGEVLGVLLKDLTRALVDLGDELVEAAGNVGGVAIQNGGVSSHDLTGVIEDDDLSFEVSNAERRIVLHVTANETTLDVLDGASLDVESDVVTRLA